MAQEIDREVLLGFVEEARGYLPRILDGIDRLHRGTASDEQLEETHRLTHSIKGAASMLGMPVLANIAYLLEEAIEQVASGELIPDGDTAEALMDTSAAIGRYLDQMLAGHVDERALMTRVVKSFRRLRSLPEAGDEVEIDRLCPAPGAEAPAVAPPAASPAEPPAAFQAPPPLTPTEDPAPPAELLEAFREEARDHLASVSQGLRQLEKQADDRQALDAVRRSVHTLKGAAAMVGLPHCADIAHRMEDLLDLLHEGQEAPGPESLALLFQTADHLEDLVEGGGLSLPEGSEAATRDELYRLYDEHLGARRLVVVTR